MYLSRARLVLQVLPELAKRVLHGDAPLNEAYEKAQLERKAAELAESSHGNLTTPNQLTVSFAILELKF